MRIKLLRLAIIICALAVSFVAGFRLGQSDKLREINALFEGIRFRPYEAIKGKTP